MTDKNDGLTKAAQLRRRAEEIARKKSVSSPEDLAILLPEDTLKMVHELQVHQIELEMQNAELIRSQAELDAVRARYLDIYNLAPVGYFILSLEGMILEVNLTAADMLNLPRAAIVKKPIISFVHPEDQHVYYLHRRELLATGKPQPCELRMLKGDGTAFWGLLTATTARDSTSNSEQDGDGVMTSRLVLSDISERKRVEDEKAELETQLKHAKKKGSAERKAGLAKSGGKPTEK